MATLALWQSDPATSAACPACGAAGLEIEDRSARPHVEWFVFRCAGCGLDETLSIPLAPPPVPDD